MNGCPHYHRRLIAQDDTIEFVECLDCGEILEDVKPEDVKLEDEPKPEPVAQKAERESESLSDA